MKIYTYPTPIDTARALIEHIIARMEAQKDSSFHLAVSGGSTPALLFKLWATEYSSQTPWQQLRLYWVDERCVPASDEQSNYRMTHETLLQAIPLTPEQIFRIQGEHRPIEEEARRYAVVVCECVPCLNNIPTFDLVLLGAGDDGHTSSVFPGQEALLTSESAYVASNHPQTGQPRIAMTGRPMTMAKETIFLINGKNKASVVANMVSSEEAGPAAWVLHHATAPSLFLDADASSLVGDISHRMVESAIDPS
ncbi:MAG: 6-phosphogluconolactonase [Bacteroides sp.]|nr:6-phosphogluconolactonase [Bacteroides sp.]